MRLSALRIFVRDIEPCRAFYGQALGLQLQADGSANGYLVFADAGIRIVVEAVAADAPADEQALVGRFTGVSFAVPDIHAEWTHLRARGVVFTGEPELQAWGGMLATLRDPAGNELQIVQYPR